MTTQEIVDDRLVRVETLSVGKARQILAAFESDTDYLSRQSKVNKALSKRDTLNILTPKDDLPDEAALSSVVARHIVKELGFDFLRREQQRNGG